MYPTILFSSCLCMQHFIRFNYFLTPVCSAKECQLCQYITGFTSLTLLLNLSPNLTRHARSGTHVYMSHVGKTEGNWGVFFYSLVDFYWQLVRTKADMTLIIWQNQSVQTQPLWQAWKPFMYVCSRRKSNAKQFCTYAGLHQIYTEYHHPREVYLFWAAGKQILKETYRVTKGLSVLLIHDKDVIKVQDCSNAEALYTGILVRQLSSCHVLPSSSSW